MITKYIKVLPVILVLTGVVRAELGDVYEAYRNEIKGGIPKSQGIEKFNKKWAEIFIASLAEKEAQGDPGRSQLIMESIALHTSIKQYDTALELSDLLIEAVDDKRIKDEFIINAAEIAYIKYHSTRLKKDLADGLVRFRKARSILKNEVSLTKKLSFINKYVGICDNDAEVADVLERGVAMIEVDQEFINSPDSDVWLSEFSRKLIKYYSKSGEKNKAKKYFSVFLTTEGFSNYPNAIIDYVQFIDGDEAEIDFASYDKIYKMIPTAKGRSHLITRLAHRLYEEKKYRKVVDLIDLFYSDEKNMINFNELSKLDKSMLTILAESLSNSGRKEEANMINEVLDK